MQFWVSLLAFLLDFTIHHLAIGVISIFCFYLFFSPYFYRFSQNILIYITQILHSFAQFGPNRYVFGSLRSPFINYNFWIHFNYSHIVPLLFVSAHLMLVQFSPSLLLHLLNSIYTCVHYSTYIYTLLTKL